jgi:probable S-adenosylmethionine-dependent methyltransferase, YraL family
MKRQKSFENECPTLYIVATPIGNLEEITFRAIRILKEVSYIAAEDTRNTVKLLNHYDIQTKLISHHEHNIQRSIPKLISLLQEGNSIALVSDAGFPAISDPGYELVKVAIENNINVVPVSGANACLDALVVSGIVPQPFLFYFFLSHQEKNKKKELMELKNMKQTLVFYEAPHRISKTISSMLEIFGNRQVALCREITKKHEEIIRGTLEEITMILDSIKGEIVLVVDGCKEQQIETITDDEIVAQVQQYIEKGMTPKDAIKEIAIRNDLNKNMVYSLYHQKGK